jgi:hypothetical protein
MRNPPRHASHLAGRQHDGRQNCSGGDQLPRCKWRVDDLTSAGARARWACPPSSVPTVVANAAIGTLYALLLPQVRRVIIAASGDGRELRRAQSSC